jgi:small conductance mechanosensitive channel
VNEAVLAAAEVLGVNNVAPEYIELRLTVKVKPGKQWMVQRELRGRISTALSEAGFERPLARIFGPQAPPQ